MKRIASTAQLQAELTKILAYARTPKPSRLLLARELNALSYRVAGEVPPQFLEHMKKKEDNGEDEKDEEKE
jgi:hypothetical protein